MGPGSFPRTDGQPTPGRSRLSAPVRPAATPYDQQHPLERTGGLPVEHSAPADRAARLAVSRDQNCAGSPPVSPQDSQATRPPRSCPGGVAEMSSRVRQVESPRISRGFPRPPGHWPC